MNEKFIITIGRQYGSGGRMIGQKLAKDLNIPCYDKELLTIAAKESGFSEEILETMDEKPTGSFLYSIVAGTYSPNYSGSHLPLNHKLFLAQFDAIRNIADKGSCVMIGRCADYALADYNVNCINVFIHADLQYRVKRVIEEYGIAPEKAEETIHKIDKLIKPEPSGHMDFTSCSRYSRRLSFSILRETPMNSEAGKSTR